MSFVSLTRSGLVTPASTLAADLTDTVMTYDPDGFLLTSTTDPAGLNLITTYTPDGLARVKTANDPLNRTTTYTYDKRGNRTKTKLPDNREHTATYDTLGRLTSTTDPKLQKTTYTHWYETSQTLTLKDAKSQTTTWSYNLRGQILTKLHPNGDDHAYTYDTLGRMRTHTTPKSEICTYTYDLRDRQTLADWNTTTPDTAKTYWANGLLKSIDNTVSKSDYAYSVRNELTSETQTLAGQPAKVVSYSYDDDGLRLQMNSPSGSPVDYTWTAKAQLADISRDGPPPLAEYTYDKAGRPDLLEHENGITEAFTFDAAGQLQGRIHKLGGTPVSGHGYTLDTTGRRTAETFSDGTTAARTYGYDTADQVTAATYGGGLADSYAYDAAANRSSATVAALGGTATTYISNSANQYTSIGGAVPRLPQHDANGNLTNDGAAVTYTWDSENRLLSVSDGTTVNTFTYDAQHRRVTKRTTVGGTVTNKVHYLYDGWNVIEERSNTDATTYYDLTTFTLTKTLTWGADLSGSLQGAGGVGGLLMAEEISGATTTAYHFQYDGNGNVTEITGASGTKAATYRYDAFGNTLVATGTYAATNRYRFSTKPLDNEIASAPLYYYGYRYYDPETGRWPSRDPIGERGGVNLYGFVGNDGVNRWDLLGQEDGTDSDPVPGFVFSQVAEGIKIVMVADGDIRRFRQAGRTAGGQALSAGKKAVKDGSFTGGSFMFRDSLPDSLANLSRPGDTITISGSDLSVAGISGALDLYAFVTWVGGSEAQAFDDLVLALGAFKRTPRLDTCNSVCISGSQYIQAIPSAGMTALSDFYAKICTCSCLNNF